MPETTIVCKTGFILPNGMFISNTGNGHPHTAKTFCQSNILSETPFYNDMCSSNMPWEDALIMAGALALASRRQPDGTIKSHIRGFKKCFLTEEQEAAVEWLTTNEGYQMYEGWTYNEEWAIHLKDALSTFSAELNFPMWEENFISKESIA